MPWVSRFQVNTLALFWDFYLVTHEEAIRLISRPKDDQKSRRPCYEGKEPEYDFSQGRRGPVVASPASKARITIRLDQDILEWFKNKVHEARGGLSDLDKSGPAGIHPISRRLLAETLRRVIKEERRRPRN